jgi:hypothetical protein
MPPRIKPGGIGTSFNCDVPNGEVEVETSTCAHCQNVTDIPNRRTMMDKVDVCRNCMRLICLSCVGKPCVPWLKKLEIMEARSRMLKDMGF